MSPYGLGRHRDDHKEHIIEQKKQYYIDNKVKISERKKAQYQAKKLAQRQVDSSIK